MSKQTAQPDAISDRFITDVCARLSENKRVRRTLPHGGRLHIDRQLPFLCVYRHPIRGTDVGTEQFVKGEASFLITPGQPSMRKSIAMLVRRVIETLERCFGGFLLVEIWAGPEPTAIEDVGGEAETVPAQLKPSFTISSKHVTELRETVAALEKALQRIKVSKVGPEVEVDGRATVRPPGLPSLFSPAEAKDLGCRMLGVQIRPIYRDAGSGKLYPAVLRSLRRGVGSGLKQAFFAFVRTHTQVRPPHYHSLGRRAMVKAVWEVDRRLAEVGNTFDFLLQVTPVNVEAAWREFQRGNCEKAPVFHYRPLAAEPSELKRRLHQISIDRIEDPTLAQLFREKQDELDRKITMLSDVGTARFLFGSLQVYGGVKPSLLSLGKEVLDRVPVRGQRPAARQLGAVDFAERAAAEIRHYRGVHSDFRASVSIRDDLYSGLLVSDGELLIGRHTRVPADRVEALVHHEIGTHLVTYYNGRAQPFRQLDLGLAGYDCLQEGLAVLSEYLVGGLSGPRLRLLAARVLAVEQLIEGATFVDTLRLLTGTHRFARRTAYTIAMRVYRGGGLTKDTLYLEGLVEILDYLRSGGEIEPLLIGKLAAEHIPVIRELRLRHVLRDPPFRPRYLDNPDVRHKLELLRRGASVLELREVTK